MEEDIQAFFIKIINSISQVLLWAMIVLGVGLYKHLLVPENEWGYPQLLFYIFSIGYLIWLIKKLIKIWK